MSWREVDAEVLGELAHRRLGQRTRLGRRTAAGCSATEWAGTAGSSDSTTAWDCAPPGANAPWTCIWVAAAASVAGRGRPLARAAQRPAVGLVAADQALALAATAGRRVGEVDLADVARGRGGSAERPAAGARADGSPMEMIGVPTGTVSPSGTSSAVTMPAYGEGSSTSDLAVSISTTMSLISTVSPSLTRQETISASVRPSRRRGAGSRPRLLLSTRAIGRRRRAAGRGRAGSPPRSGRRGRACRSRRPAAPATPASRSTPPGSARRPRSPCRG